MAGKKQIHNMNSHQIGLDSWLWSCMRMRMINGSMKIVLYGDWKKATYDTFNKHDK